MMTEADGIGPDGGDIRDLFSYNLQRLAGVSTRIALLSIKPRFDLNMHDWRALAVLDYLGAAPLHVLAQRAGVQKSQMSRTTAALEARGLIERTENPEDRRSTLLQVTVDGAALVRAVLAESRLRNEAILKELDADERRDLMKLMEKVTRGALEHLSALRRVDIRTAPTVPPPQSIVETEEF